MEAFLDESDLWEAVEEDYEVPPLPGNPTLAQIKTHKEKKTRKTKAKACLFASVFPTIFSRIMICSSVKDIWDLLKKEYQRDERIKGMKVLNLIREFEMQHIKESETIKDYSDWLISIANKATIASLENSKDLSKVSLAELLSSLQAHEQRRLMRQEGSIESALQTKLQLNSGGSSNKGGKYTPCQYCGRKNHPYCKCRRKPDMRYRKCQKLGHAESMIEVSQHRIVMITKTLNLKEDYAETT
uniref:CCHC-type domain-containing protein n=1 Tax=Manihot esculenta TaxID=3983 RepID=A0A2C9VSY4_MANES